MSGIGREDGDVADLVLRLDLNEIDRAEEALGLADRVGQRCERARVVLESHAQSRTEGCGLVERVPAVRRVPHLMPTVLPFWSGLPLECRRAR